MVTLALLASSIGFVVLSRIGRLHALLAIAVAAIASGGAWAMVVRTARLPRAMAATHQKDESLHYPLALSKDELLLRGDLGIVRVELPSLRITSVLPWRDRQKPGVMTQVAWSGRVLLVAWHNGAEGASYGLVGRDRWVVAPRATPDNDASAAAFWDRAAGAFVVASRAQDPHTSERVFTWIDEKGAELQSLRMKVPFEVQFVRSVCANGDDIVATTGYSTCRTRAPRSGGAVWKCERGVIGQIADCPEHVESGTRSTTWLAGADIATYPALPDSLARDSTRVSGEDEVLLGPAGVEPATSASARITRPSSGSTEVSYEGVGSRRRKR